MSEIPSKPVAVKSAWTWRAWMGIPIAAIIVGAAMIPVYRPISALIANHPIRWRGFDMEGFLALEAILRAHILAALCALALGASLMAQPKGRGLHKALGWVFAAAMGLTAATSFWITGLNGDAYSLIHLLSGCTLISLPLAILAIRRRNVAAHRRAMMGLFYGGLVFTGLLTLIPGRVMFSLFFR